MSSNNAGGRGRDDKAVKIDRKLASKAKVIAEVNGTSVSEYLSELLRPLIQQDFGPAIKKLSAEDKERAVKAAQEEEAP